MGCQTIEQVYSASFTT